MLAQKRPQTARVKKEEALLTMDILDQEYDDDGNLIVKDKA